MSIRFAESLPKPDEYCRLFETTDWNLEYRLTKQQLFESIGHSWYAMSAYDKELLVGFGRVISDGILHALIVDMMVHPDYQRRGIGGYILDQLVRRCRSRGIRDIQLFCATGKSEFYRRNGFVERPVAAPGMELPAGRST